jgi:hypothetical protein
LPEDRFNVFQRLARTWDAVHPYNAGQACLVAGSFEADVLQRSWPAPARALRVLTPTEDLSRHFTAELNRPFDDDPFRPFVQCAGDATWLGVIYQHRIADSFSIRELIRRWVERIRGEASFASSGPRRVACDGIGIASLLHLVRRYGDYRRVRKVHTMGPLDHAVRVRVLEPLHGLIPRALRYARSHGVKLNDVFVAALAESCDRFVPTQARAGRRDLAVSSIVDLRPYLAREIDRRRFGCHLGFTGAVCHERDMNDWQRLLGSVSRQNQIERRGRFGPPGVAWMHAAEIATRYVKPARVYDFYRKEAPFAGGISNVNLNDTWFHEQHAAGRVLDYVRVSPTGPMVPVVLNVTTLGEDMRLTMTYRSNLFNDWTAAELAEMFTRRIASFASV